MNILKWLWSLLPDKCEMQGCLRKGIRGNEMRWNGMVLCDYCHAQWLAPKRHTTSGGDVAERR